MRNSILGLAAIAAIAIPLTIAPAANAAAGAELINVDFEDGVTTLAGEGAATDFVQTTYFGQANNGPAGSMWDPGVYAIGSNPKAFHAYWVDWSGTVPADNWLIVNGFTSTNQKVASITVNPEPCTTPGSNVTYQFSANMANILPLSAASDGGAAISVTINGVSIGSEVVLTNDPTNVVEIVGAVAWAPSLEVTLWNNGTAYSGNDFAIDDIKLTQMGECEPPCETVVNGVWHNYTGKFTGSGTPALTDPKWKALPATPGGEHDLALRGFDKPYNPGADKGKGDWFLWKDLGTTCPA